MADDRSALVTDKLKRREEERQIELNRRKLERDNLTPAQEKAEYFLTNFSDEKSKIEKRLEECESLTKSELPSEFDSIAASLQILQKFVADSTMFLSSYEVRNAQESLKKLQFQIQEKRDKLIPKKKFAFRAKKKVGEKIEKVNGNYKNGMLDNPVDCVNSNGTSSSTDSVELADCKLVDMQNETLSMPSVDIEQKDVALARLSNCTIKLLGAPSTVHMKNLNDCVVLCGPVSSSIFITDCVNCVFVLACQQLRTHSTKKCTFYLHVTSRAIIEDCTELEFAPYNLRYPELENHFIKSGLDSSRNNWNDVDDFNWLAVDAHSPNWSLLPEEKRNHNWNG